MNSLSRLAMMTKCHDVDGSCTDGDETMTVGAIMASGQTEINDASDDCGDASENIDRVYGFHVFTTLMIQFKRISPIYFIGQTTTKIMN